MSTRWNESPGHTAFYAGAKAVSIVLTVALQIIGILQVNTEVLSAMSNDLAAQVATPSVGGAFIIVFLASMVLAIEAAIDLASLARPRVNALLHPFMYRVQQSAPGLTIAAVLLSLLLLVADGSGLVSQQTSFPFLVASLVCVILETPFIMLVFFDLAGCIVSAQSGAALSDRMAQPSAPQIRNMIDPMLDYLDTRREGV